MNISLHTLLNTDCHQAPDPPPLQKKKKILKLHVRILIFEREETLSIELIKICYDNDIYTQ